MSSTSLASIAPSKRTRAVTSAAHDCLHCGQSIAAASISAYCCLGCETVHSALSDGDLLRYYDLRGGRAEPVGELHLERRDKLWIEPLAAQLAASDKPVQLTLGVQGLRCAACVWLIQELFQREHHGDHILVNAGRGTLSLHVRPDFPLRQFVAQLERFGYLLGTARDAGTRWRRLGDQARAVDKFYK